MPRKAEKNCRRFENTELRTVVSMNSDISNNQEAPTVHRKHKNEKNIWKTEAGVDKKVKGDNGKVWGNGGVKIRRIK